MNLEHNEANGTGDEDEDEDEEVEEETEDESEIAGKTANRLPSYDIGRPKEL